MDRVFYVGGYSDDIYRLRLHTEAWTLDAEAVAAQRRPSWLETAPGLLYAVTEAPLTEGRQGELRAYALNDEAPRLTSVVKDLPPLIPYFSLGEKGKALMAVSYGTGEVLRFKAGDGDGLGSLLSVALHRGSGPNPQRQASAHPHFIRQIPGRQAYLMCDLGTDEVVRYDVDGTRLWQRDAVKLPAGQGPRHLAFDPQNPARAYLLTEMGYTLFTLSVTDDALTIIEEIPLDETLCDDQRAGAAIRVSPDGRFLYLTNRGAGAARIDILSLEGRPRIIGQVTGLLHPRDLLITRDGALALCADQHRNRVILCRRDPATGLLSDTGLIAELPSPTCVAEAFD